ncbi:MAG: sigma-70 family RNA polymerase sigma factor [Alistipes sp.]|nr:sigma-70 family RNA polymerase sigma factor [Alistipes sp.]
MKTNEQRMKTIGRLVVESRDALYRFALFRLGSRDEAEDAVQDVCLKLVSGVDLASVGNVRSYLMRCVSNACVDRLRSRRSDTRPVECAAAAEPADPAEREAGRVGRLLAGLPAEQAEVIRLRIDDELDVSVIAEILDIPVTTAKSRFAYGISKLRRLLSAESDS